MNMLSLFALGQSLESLFGSLHFFFLLSVYTIGCGVLYCALAFLISVIWNPYTIIQGAVGFSGVLFAMAVDESSLSVFPTRSVFGLFSVPTKIYPWVLMLIIQLLLPGVSLMGHFAGIVLGMIHTSGYLAWALPSLVTLRKLEQAAWFERIKRTSMYKLVPNSDVVLDRSAAGESTFRVAVNWIKYVLAPVTQCLAPYLRRVLPARFFGSGANSAPAAVQRRVDDSGAIRSGSAAATATPPAAAAQPWYRQPGASAATGGASGQVPGGSPQAGLAGQAAYAVPSAAGGGYDQSPLSPGNDIGAGFESGGVAADFGGEGGGKLRAAAIESAGGGAQGHMVHPSAPPPPAATSLGLGAYFGGASQHSGYDQLASTEESADDLLMGSQNDVGAGTGHGSSASTATAAAPAPAAGAAAARVLTPEQIQKRDEMRAKAAAAAEARAAATTRRDMPTSAAGGGKPRSPRI